MKSSCTYAIDGFQVITDVVGEPLLNQAIAEIERITAEYATLSQTLQQKITLLTDLPPRQFSVAQAEVPPLPYIIAELPAFGDAFKDLLLQPALWQHAAEILETMAITYHFSNVTTKPARVGPRLNWHRDFPNRYICPQTSRFTRLLIPLDGMDQSNGCTQIVKNSHCITDAEARNAPKPSRMEPSPETVIDILCAPGDVFFLHPKSIHGGGQNESTHHRRVVIIQFGVAGEPLVTDNQELFTGSTYQQIKNESFLWRKR